MMAALPQSVAVPIGVIKQFGPFGPEYQVLGPAEPQDGIARIHIVIVRTGEETTYGFNAMLDDPEAR